MDAAALEVLGPPLIGLELGRYVARHEQVLAADSLSRLAVLVSLEADDHVRVGAGAADDPVLAAGDGQQLPGREQGRVRLGHVKASVESMGTPDAPGS